MLLLPAEEDRTLLLPATPLLERFCMKEQKRPHFMAQEGGEAGLLWYVSVL